MVLDSGVAVGTRPAVEAPPELAGWAGAATAVHACQLLAVPMTLRLDVAGHDVIAIDFAYNAFDWSGSLEEFPARARDRAGRDTSRRARRPDVRAPRSSARPAPLVDRLPRVRRRAGAVAGARLPIPAAAVAGALGHRHRPRPGAHDRDARQRVRHRRRTLGRRAHPARRGAEADQRPQRRRAPAAVGRRSPAGSRRSATTSPQHPGAPPACSPASANGGAAEVEHIVLFAGPMGAGKTTAIQSLSDIPVITPRLPTPTATQPTSRPRRSRWTTARSG